MRSRKHSIILLMFFMVGLLASLSEQVYAVTTGSDWRPGDIIADEIFTDSSSMTVQQVQAFLNNQVPVCDVNGTKSITYMFSASTGQVSYGSFSGGTWVTTTRAVFAQRYNTYFNTTSGNMPFTCLKDYFEVPKTAPGSALPENNANGAPMPTGALSAAQLIYDAGIAYGVNPKVLLVKLGTESAGPLTSDDWPFRNQFMYAMGAHCPDSGPGGTASCDSNYSGFSIQMREAARLLRWYLDNMSQPWWTYKKPYQTNYILWNVQQSGCGGGNVYIDSKATAALYTYTPYQPNQAALNNMYGTGDGCSAYGNRNFWRVYNDWFGPTTISGCGLNEVPLPYVNTFYNPKTQRHFFSAYSCESYVLTSKLGYVLDGPEFNTTESTNPNAVPVYRLYNQTTQLHMWTISSDEIAQSQKSSGYTLEGVAYYVANNVPGTTPVYRLYNPKTFQHIWTQKQAVITLLVGHTDFILEGVAFYAQ